MPLFLMLALANAALTLTVTRSLAFRWLRDALAGAPVLGVLLSCPWCFSHWGAMALFLLVRPAALGSWLDFIVYPLALVAATAPLCAGAYLCIVSIKSSD